MTTDALADDACAPFVDGGSFVLDAPRHVPAVWGADSEVLWAMGEPCMLCGPQGVGKSTIAQQLVLARIGLHDLEVLGLMVTPDPDRRVLYIAGDRPNQIARSMRRMVAEHHRKPLSEALWVWRGPLPFDLALEPDRLLAMAQAAGAGTVVIDSLKDVAVPLTEDRVGSAYNRAAQLLVANDIEVLTLHHQRKATSDNKKPTSLADVYGSGWITAGQGSVVLVWGEAGDPAVELIHMKQPADTVGPLELTHDHHAGRTSVEARPTAFDLVAAATNGGITVADAAVRLYGPSPDRNQIEKARRKLDQLVRQNHAAKVPGEQPKDPSRYRPIANRVMPRDSDRDLSRADHGASRAPGITDHAAITADHALASEHPPPLKGVGRDAAREATPQEQAVYEHALQLTEGTP